MCEPAESDRIATPAEEIQLARKLWLIGLRVRLMAMNGDIDPALAGSAYRIRLPEGVGEIGEDDIDQDTLVAALENISQTQLGTMATVATAALQRHFGNTENYSNPVRAIIYMIRCAFAHDPIQPRWKCDGPRARERYEMTTPEDVLVRVDGSELDGQPFSLSQVGGINGLLGLLESAHDLVAPEE